MLVPIPQRELIDQDRTERKPPRVDQSFGRHLAVDSKDAFELLVQVLDRARPQFVEHPPHIDTIISMRILSTLGRYDHPIRLRTRRRSEAGADSRKSKP